MSAPGPIDAFVIFAAPDRDRAGALCHALRGAGLRVYSRNDLKPGDYWDTVLPERLSVARAVVILISAQWASSHYDPEDVAVAIKNAEAIEPPPRLIPVWLDGALHHTPYGLTRVSGVHVADDDFTDAATQIAAVLDPTATTPPPPEDADSRRRPPREPDAVTATRDRPRSPPPCSRSSPGSRRGCGRATTRWSSRAPTQRPQSGRRPPRPPRHRPVCPTASRSGPSGRS